MNNELNEFALQFGKISINLRGVEFVARFLLNKKSRIADLPKRIDNYEIGESLPLSWLTNDAGFYKVMAEFKKEYNFDVDVERLNSLRNAFAHGRLSALQPEGTLHLFNVKRTEKNDPTKVELAWMRELDKDWLKSEGNYIADLFERMRNIDLMII